MSVIKIRLRTESPENRQLTRKPQPLHIALVAPLRSPPSRIPPDVGLRHPDALYRIETREAIWPLLLTPLQPQQRRSECARRRA
jgi:hypothetical protein